MVIWYTGMPIVCYGKLSAMHCVKSIRYSFLLLLMVLITVVPAGAAEPPAPAKTALTAVIPADFPPTYFRDQNGQAAGLAVDVMDAVARRAGLTITYRFAKPWLEIEDLVGSGEADLIPLRVMNETNRQTLLFTTPLDISYVHYVVRADDLHQKPRPGCRIGVINNSTALEYLKKQPVNNQLVTYDSLEHMLIDLLSGRIDMLLTVTDNLKNLGERLRLEDRFKIVSPAEFEVKRGIAVQAGNRRLQEQLNRAIESFHADQESGRIYQKWLSKPVPYWTPKRVVLLLGSLFVVAAGGLLAWHITILRRSNCKLKAEQSFLQTMIDAIPDFIFFKDRNSVYLGGNRAFAEQVHGCGKEALVGHTDAELLNNRELADYFIKTDQEVMDSGNQIKLEVQMPLKDGRTLRAESIKTPFRNEAGEVIGVIGIARDITERFNQQLQLEEARERAEAASRAKSQFLANVSHEIRTPLNGVLGMAQLLALSNLDQEQREQLGMIQSSGENLLTILNDILDLAKIEADMLQLVHKPFSPAALVNEVSRLYTHLCSQKEIELVTDIGQELPAAVLGDPQRIKQILFNLLGNAVKFTHQGTIRLSCHQAGASPDQVSLQFSVCDTGIGISPRDQERIFAPFEQVDNSNTREYGGTGLGLSICRRLTQMMAGTLALQSSPGKGSCFTLTLGLAPVASAAVAEQQQPAAQAAVDAVTQLTVLVAEDNRINRFFIAKLLRQMGHQVLEAEDGQQALALLEQQRCDLVLMDIQMPVLDGTEALKEIRRQDAAQQCHTRVIALTAYAMEGDRCKFLAQGFDGYLPKPLNSGDLEAAVADALAGKSVT